MLSLLAIKRNHQLDINGRNAAREPKTSTQDQGFFKYRLRLMNDTWSRRERGNFESINRWLYDVPPEKKQKSAGKPIKSRDHQTQRYSDKSKQSSTSRDANSWLNMGGSDMESRWFICQLCGSENYVILGSSLKEHFFGHHNVAECVLNKRVNGWIEEIAYMCCPEKACPRLFLVGTDMTAHVRNVHAKILSEKRGNWLLSQPLVVSSGNVIKAKEEIIKPTYRCEFCRHTFDSVRLIESHLQEFHQLIMGDMIRSVMEIVLREEEDERVKRGRR